MIAAACRPSCGLRAAQNPAYRLARLFSISSEPRCHNEWRRGDDAGPRTRNFGDDIFHRQITNRRRGVKIVLFDVASVALELFNDVGLCLTNRIRPRWARTAVN